MGNETGKSSTSPIAWMRWIPGVLLAILALTLVIFGLRIVLLPILLSVAMAYLLAPLTTWLERRGWSRSSSALLTVLGACLLGVLALIFIAPSIWRQVMVSYDQGSRLVSDPARVERLLDRIRTLSPVAYDAIQDTVRGYRDPEKQEQLKQVFVSWLERGIFGLVDLTTTILDLMLVPFFVYYLLSDYKKVRSRIDALIPPRHRTVASNLIKSLSVVLSTYIRNQMLISLIMGVLYGLGFVVLHVPLGFKLGLLAGLLNFIPYLGTTTGLLLSVGFVALDGAGLWRIGGVLAIFAAVQALEGYYLTPKLLGSSLNLHPMWVLLGLLIGANLFGILGIILAVPVIAAGKVILHFIEEVYRDSQFYKRSTSELLTGEGVPAEMIMPADSVQLITPGSDDEPVRERRVVITTGELRSRISSTEE